MFLVDTNVISELAHAHPEPRVLRWAQEQRSVTLSVITVEEIAFGIARHSPARRTRLTAWFESLIASAARIYEINLPVARISAELRARREAAGHRAAQADMLIAATALAHGLTLATQNTKDFTGCGIALIDPFT